MGYWSAENASEAYTKTMKMGKRPNEPDTAEFISAIAVGNNAKLMVVACASAAGPTTLGLAAASHQTGGKLVCIVKGLLELSLSKQTLNQSSKHVEFVVGNAQHLLSHEYKSADLVVIDCNLKSHENILEAMHNDREKSTLVLGYNAFLKDSWLWSRSNSHLLPIGEGLLLMRVAGKRENGGVKSGSYGGYSSSRRSHWVVKVDKCTGEEHVFRVRSPSSGSVVKA